MICVNSVTVNPKQKTMNVGEWCYDLSVSVTPANATCQCVTWHSSNTEVATVNPTSGYVYAKKKGTVNIYATATDGSGASDYCTVTVEERILVQSLVMQPVEVTMPVGATDTLEAHLWPENATDKRVCWESCNPCIASVDDNGVVTANSVGETQVYAMTLDGSECCDYCTIIVFPVVEVESITVSPAEKTMSVGEQVQLVATVSPANATYSTVTWSSSDSNVATVDEISGCVEAKRSGTCSINATTVSGEFTVCCKVTVEPILTYPDTLIEDSNTRSKILKIKFMLDENEKAYVSGKISHDEKELIESQLQKECDIIRADYIAVKNNPTSNYAYAILGGDKAAVVPSSFSDVLTLNSCGLAVTVVQRTLEVMGYYEPEPDETYGIFDANTYNAAASYPYLLSYDNETKQYVFDNLSFNVLFQNSTSVERTYEAFAKLNSFRAAHNTVAIWSAEKVGGTYKMSDNKIKNGNVTGTYYGYADVLKNTSTGTYIWEVKPDDLRYYKLGGLGSRQLQRYINAGNAYDQGFNKPAIAGYRLGTFSIPYINGRYINVRGGEETAFADDVRTGLILYEVSGTPQYELETIPVEVEVPSVSYDYAEGYAVDTEMLGSVVLIGIVVVFGIVCLCMCPATAGMVSSAVSSVASVMTSAAGVLLKCAPLAAVL